MIKKWKLLIFWMFVCLYCIGCETVAIKEKKPKDKETLKYLIPDENADELFRVFMSSDEYVVSQMRHHNVIRKKKDQGMDQYMCDVLGKLDKVDAIREGAYTVYLFPDRGTLMRIRPRNLTYVKEIDRLIVEDIQRWEFEFPARIIEPTKFDIRYRIKLQKKQSDEEIMKEVREKIKEKTKQR